MEEIKFNYKTNITQKQLKEIEKKLSPAIDKILAAQKTGYNSDYCSVNLPNDKKYFNLIKKIIDKKIKYKPKAIVIAGIGGSSLGPQAIYLALKEKTTIECIFADTIEPQYTNEILQKIEKILKANNEIILAVISKSGTTTETLVNGSLILDLLKKLRPKNYKDFIVTITDEDSKLETVAIENKIDNLSVPQLVGGRYSVFSSVGLFPLGILNFDIEKLLNGAKKGIDLSLQKKLDKNLAALSAAIIYLEYKDKKNIHDTYIFNPELATLGAWYRQLMGESLGKQKDLKGKTVNVGITPTVSIGTNDLHSVTQLYLAGPADKTTTFINSPAQSDKIKISKNIFSQINPQIINKSVGFIHDAIFEGVIKAYERKKRPYISITLPELNEYYLGQLMQIKMIEMMFLGHLLNINPFNQPEVELYKQETRRILSL
ncbi:hypothetical protein M1446_03885 [Candidatus Dependentiae bacterium]|nr:hypothetical protein [Candidatus Dependentiae bacterium]